MNNSNEKKPHPTNEEAQYEDDSTNENFGVTGLNEEMIDDISSGEGYSIRGDLTEDVLTEGGIRGGGDMDDLIISSKERGTIADEDTSEDEAIRRGDALP